ncbi:hypothetical protein Bxe_B0553 [Paraburkholderia xenovorans LB400]|uniref:Uncharacterized protein n=1 Tax=Paraburkholderia xenovorans (strain LB400) TaxID=266265 RepID=Q13KJ4_PARXL|nr:hypothetical protein Bxe_B0553 [Paraburkholderia xenovorans LB400]
MRVRPTSLPRREVSEVSSACGYHAQTTQPPAKTLTTGSMTRDVAPTAGLSQRFSTYHEAPRAKLAACGMSPGHVRTLTRRAITPAS